MNWGTDIPAFAASCASCRCIICICSGEGIWPGWGGPPAIPGCCIVGAGLVFDPEDEEGEGSLEAWVAGIQTERSR